MTLLVTPEHTADARAALGPDRLLAVMLPTVLATTRPAGEAARARAVETLGFLLRVPGYRANTRRLGFTDDEIDTVADRLVDAVTAQGTPDDVAARVAEHHAAGADHVVLSPLGDASGGVDTVRALAGSLSGRARSA